MTKVDEGAQVPRIGVLERDKLTRALDRDHVVAGILFGSQVTGEAGSLSDVDIAVWLDPAFPSDRRSALRAELSLAAIEALGTDEVDVVVLNEAPPLLRHRALKGGARLFDRDPRARVRLETTALLEYFDTAPLRKTLAAGRRRRIEEAALVDAERIGSRLDRLEHLVELLDEVRAGGEGVYLADERLRAMTERWLQLAIQACIDIGAQLVSELSVEPPADYAGVFRSLAAGGHIERDLGDALAAAAGQRNVLVHMYPDVDDREVFAALGRLEELRRFAAAAQALADRG